MMLLKQSTAVTRVFYHGTAGQTIDITISKNGGAFGSPSVGASTLTEISNGFYKFALTTTDTNTLGQLAYYLAVAGLPVSGLVGIDDQVVADLPGATVSSVTGSVGSVTGSVGSVVGDTPQTGDSFARLGAPAGVSMAADIAAIKAETEQRPTKNTALANFPFIMIDSSDHETPKTGLTVTAQRSLDGGAFGNCANAVSEIGNGWYKINLAAGDMNGDTVALKFTATGADPTNVTLVTQPT